MKGLRHTLKHEDRHVATKSKREKQQPINIAVSKAGIEGCGSRLQKNMLEVWQEVCSVSDEIVMSESCGGEKDEWWVRVVSRAMH
jgi:hypothetical protein